MGRKGPEKAGQHGKLLPESLEEFRSVEFWDHFFQARGSQPFEWYGDWQQLRDLAHAQCQEKTILVIGCGNSELSSQMYDDGCQNITNIDFSRTVIRDMMAKNLRVRPCMRWQVMDMTQMKFPDGSFEVVMDKGGLDALMGEDDAQADEAGSRLLSEVARVLNPLTGTYLCVTLAQPHVLRKLLNHMADGWRFNIQPVPPTEDMVTSPLQPLLVIISRGPSGQQLLPQLPVFTNIDASPNAEQLADVEKVLREHKSVVSGSSPDAPSTPLPREAERAERDEFASYAPGRRLTLTLPCEGEGADPQPVRKVGVGLSHDEADDEEERKNIGGGGGPRFSAAVLDLDTGRARTASRPCAVFIVPQGREHEWLFGSEEGQWQVATQCSAARLIFMSLNRGHQFASLKAVQSEVSQVVHPLLPAEQRGKSGDVPIMTSDDGIGSRTVLEEMESSISGRIAVEDVLDGSGSKQRTLRRMVFVSNRGLIQSEAVLVPAAPSTPPTAASARKGKAGKGKAKSKAVQENGGARSEPATLVVDPSQLSFEYHSAIVASTALISDPGTGKPWRAMVVGLGGGGLPLFLHTQLAMHVTAVELDPAVLTLARRHFGLADSDTFQARVQDGLQAVAEAGRGAEERLDLLVVDAGSSDASQAMSCPPPPFLERQFLDNAHAALRPGGVLAVNCVTRSPEVLRTALAAVQGVFEGVCIRDIDDDVNCVVFATSKPLPDGLKEKGRAALKKRFRQLWPALAAGKGPAGASAYQGHIDNLTLAQLFCAHLCAAPTV